MNLSPLRWKAFGVLEEKEANSSISWQRVSIVGGRDGGAMAKKDICNERLLQILPVTSQVAISRRVRRHKLAFGTVKRREGGGNKKGADADGVGLSHRC